MDRLFDILENWPPGGQGLFLVICLIAFCCILGGAAQFFLVLVRGRGALGDQDRPRDGASDADNEN